MTRGNRGEGCCVLPTRIIVKRISAGLSGKCSETALDRGLVVFVQICEGIFVQDQDERYV